MGTTILESGILNLGGGPANAGKGHPVIVSLVEVLEVDVVGVRILIFRLGGIVIYIRRLLYLCLIYSQGFSPGTTFLSFSSALPHSMIYLM